MIDWLVRIIFSWRPLYEAVTNEVHMYDSIGRSIDSGTGAVFWQDQDGWRGWSYNEERNKYYFNDIPELDLIFSIQAVEEMEAWSN
jgi:hypothetical protein